MNRKWAGMPLGACLILAACGGSGGSVSPPSTGAPPPTPAPAPAPAPTNSTVDDLRANQAFINDAATASVTLDLTTRTTISGRGAPDTLAVSYDATSNSYTLAAGGKTQNFGPGNITVNDAAEAKYQKLDGSPREYLTLLKTPYSSNTITRYVRLGYWQRNTLDGNRQGTEYSSFTYGFDTPASAVPRSGVAAFAIDVFGLSSFPGYEPRAFQGSGKFSADFAAGVFSARSSLTETGLITGNGVVGGGIELTTAGRLSSTNGTFAGNVSYGGTDGQIGGTLAGRLYGPNGQELGASFSGSTPSGASVAGSLTGQRSTTQQPENLTLTNLTKEQLFYPGYANLTVTEIDGRPGITVRSYSSVGQLNRLNEETFSYGPGTSNLPGGQYTINDKVASTDPNFIAYRKTLNGQDVSLQLYRAGAANSELALTYASLGRWSTSKRENVVTDRDQVFFAYGLSTPDRLLSAKTGTGQYRGVVYGAAANQRDGSTYDVRGTSQFAVDFSSQRYSGSLGLNGTGTNGTASLDFGSFEFAGPLAAYAGETAVNLSKNGMQAGEMRTRFYGPDGEEIAGTFTASVPDGAVGAGTLIVGATVARRQ